jgi:RNA polymerase sigma factor (sigma-70 family)
VSLGQRAGAAKIAEERDEGGLVAFCRAHYDELVGALGLYCGRRDVAEDIAQDALLQVCRHWDQVRTMESPAAWTFTVAFNLARSRFRRVGRQWRALTRLGGVQEPVARPADTTTTVAVRQAIAGLPPRQRMVIVLRFYVDLSVKQAADAMGCAEGTVKALTAQAIAGLRAAGLEVDDA